MSLFPAIFGFPGQLGFFGAPLAPEQRGAEKPVKPLDPLDRQQWSPLVGPGSFPGFDKAPPLTVDITWQMRAYSAIVLAYAVTTGPILAGTQTVEVADKKAEGWKEDAEKHILSLMPEVLPGAMECLHFGAWLQEVVWDTRDGKLCPTAFRSILPAAAEIYQDRYRQFAGYRLGEVYRDKRYAFLAVNDPHIDPLFGYSRNSNARVDWWRALQSNENGDRTERKASGIQMAIGVPSGMTFTDESGQPVMPKGMAQTILNAAVKGDAFTYPLTPFRKEDIARNPALADISAIKVQQFDWGNTAPAILASMGRIDALDKRMMRAWRRPERESMEGQFGTKAEAGVHGQIGVTDSELVHAMVLRQFNKQVFDQYLIANYGPDAAGKLYLKPTPLSDPQQQFLQQAWLALAANAATAPTLISHVNPRLLNDRVEMPMVTEEEAAKVQADAEQKKQEQQKQQADAAKQSANGNGKMNGEKLALSISRIGEFLED